MSRDQQPGPTPLPEQGGWGEYDPEATGYTPLPGGVPGYPGFPGYFEAEPGTEPLAAPGQGFAPPEFPAPRPPSDGPPEPPAGGSAPFTPAASTDPAATGQWTLPFAPAARPADAAEPPVGPDRPEDAAPQGAAGPAAVLGQGAAAALAGSRGARGQPGPEGDEGGSEAPPPSVGEAWSLATHGPDPAAGGTSSPSGPGGPGGPGGPLSGEGHQRTPGHEPGRAHEDVRPASGADWNTAGHGGGDPGQWAAPSAAPAGMPPAPGQDAAPDPERRRPLAAPDSHGAGDGFPGSRPPSAPADRAFAQEHGAGGFLGAPPGGPFPDWTGTPPAGTPVDPPGPPGPPVPPPVTGEVPPGGTSGGEAAGADSGARRPEDPGGEPSGDTAADTADRLPGAAARAASDLAHSEHPHTSYVLHVNEVDCPVTDAWIGESLLYVLRERLGLAGAKDGCAQGECGACSVQVDGRLVASCLVPAATAADSEIRTVEGLAADGSPSDVQRALAESGAVQCGFCAPGMAMTLHDLLEGNHSPTDLETRKAVCGNLCRCSGYRGVLEAVRTVAAEREERAARALEEAAEGGADSGGHPAQGGGDRAGTLEAAVGQAPGPPEQPRIPQQAGPYGDAPPPAAGRPWTEGPG